LTLQNTCEHN